MLELYAMIEYRSLNSYLKERFGCKVYKLALDGGFTCPNRDGTVGSGGCIFCLSGSSDFAVPCRGNVAEAIETARLLVSNKKGSKFIAYFQSYTGTYDTVENLRKLYLEAALCDDIVAISIGTRPDCLPDEVISLLKEINAIKPVWIELGLQTIHEQTANYIRRGYSLQVFDDAVKRLKSAGIEIIVHMIIGLPGETDEMIRQTAEYIGRSGADGIKFQLLHVLRGTDLADDYEQRKFEVLSMDEYFRILVGCLERIPKTMVVHRLTGDGAKRDLIAPLWSADKKKVMNEFKKYLEQEKSPAK